MLKINCELVEKILVSFIKDSVRKNGFQNAIVGVSGGLDSAVVLALCRRPWAAATPSPCSSPTASPRPKAWSHGELVCARFKVPYEVIDISPSVDAYFDRFPAANTLQIGNKCARERMSVLYDFSVRKKALVAGTSNKSELLVGYSTQFGDSAAAFLPIGDLYKTQVFELARHLGIPEEIIAKKPVGRPVARPDRRGRDRHRLQGPRHHPAPDGRHALGRRGDHRARLPPAAHPPHQENDRQLAVQAHHAAGGQAARRGPSASISAISGTGISK